jgi:hypothetical protein
LRALFDHNGYPAGRRSEFRENWAQTVTNLTANGLIASLPNWSLTASGSPTGLSTAVNFSGFAALPAAHAQLDPGTANNNRLSIGTGQLLYSDSYISLTCEWEAALTSGGANNQAILMGLASGNNILGGGSGLYIQKGSTDTNWIVQTLAGGASNANTGIPPVAGALQRFRIEYHGSATPIGIANGNVAVAIFFVNETPTLINTNVPSGVNSTSFNLSFGVLNQAGLGGAQPIIISPVLVTWNRQLSIAAL